MAVDGETLMEYNIRVGLATSTSMWSARVDRLNQTMDRKSEYPPSATRLLAEVEERRRLAEQKKKIEDDKNKQQLDIQS